MFRKMLMILTILNILCFVLYNAASSNSSEDEYSGPVYGKWDNEIRKLRRDLLQGYNKFCPPVDKVNRNETKVWIYLFLRFVNDFNEVSGHLESTVLIQTWWIDSRLGWEPSKYNGFDGRPGTGSLIFDFKEIWVPHIILWNPINKFEILDPSNDHLLARAYPDSYMFFIFGGKITSHCVPDVKYFPFDRHECYIQLLTYESLYFPKQIKVESRSIENKFGFDENPQWTVSVGVPEVSDFLTEGIYVVKFPITLERRSLFLLFNLFAPILLLSLINVCVFAIPIQSGERSSFAITVFLALAVYMTVVADNIPHSSNPMPLWSYFLLLKLIYSACIALCSTIIMRFANKNEPLPPCLHRLLKAGKKQIRKYSSRRKAKIKTLKRDSIRNGSMYEEHEVVQVGENSVESEQEKVKVSWKDAANVLDKIFLTFFLFVAFLEMFFTFVFTYTKI